MRITVLSTSIWLGLGVLSSLLISLARWIKRTNESLPMESDKIGFVFFFFMQIRYGFGFYSLQFNRKW